MRHVSIRQYFCNSSLFVYDSSYLIHGFVSEAEHNLLPAECEETADLLLVMDKLFYSFNAHSYTDSANIFKVCLKNNSPHFKLWNELLPILQSMTFKTIKRRQDGTEELWYEIVPSLQNWIHNIKTFKEIWEFLKLYIK